MHDMLSERLREQAPCRDFEKNFHGSPSLWPTGDAADSAIKGTLGHQDGVHHIAIISGSDDVTPIVSSKATTQQQFTGQSVPYIWDLDCAAGKK